MKVDYLAGVSRVTVKGIDRAPVATSLRRLGLAKVAPLLGRVVGERYRIQAVLGRGATSIVCKATRLDGEGLVAVKVLSPISSDLVDAAISDRFQFEARALAEIRHPNIVSVLDFGATDDGLLYTVMELLEGETLSRRLASRGRLEPDDAVWIACGVAEALHALHARSLLHRDVKPANVFIVRDADGAEAVKLMDLGLARALGASEEDESGAPADSVAGARRRMHTQEGLVLGTGPYMSPELIQGTELDARSDVYALAVVMYRMLTGTLPFAGNDLPHLLSLHLCDPVEPLTARAPSAGLSAALDAVVLRALEKDRERRPATAREFAYELRACLQPGGSVAPLEAPFATGDFPSRLQAALPAQEAVDVRRRRAAWMVAVVVALAALLTGSAVIRRLRAPLPVRRDTSFAAQRPAFVNSTRPAVDPWNLVVGEARLDPQPSELPRERTRSGSRRSTERRALTPRPPVGGSAIAVTPDDFKVPPWRVAAPRTP